MQKKKMEYYKCVMKLLFDASELTIFYIHSFFMVLIFL